MYYSAKDGHVYQFNLIDTPGHVDFTYEYRDPWRPAKALLLVIDAAQGVQAQSLANVHARL